MSSASSFPTKRPQSDRMPSLDKLTLLAVGVVIMLVSLPRLHGLMLRTNECDARDALRLLGGVVFAGERTPTNLCETVEQTASLEHQLSDARPVDGGRVLKHHGYLFELSSTLRGESVIYAWPSEHGRTGKRAFALKADQGMIEHENEGKSTWSGLARPLHADETELSTGNWQPR
jgi:hypothetical protein